MKKKIAIIGAGPAGLTAAYLLAKKNYNVHVYESKNFVGGMSSSFKLWKKNVDLGPHRFFSSDSKVNKFWLEIIKDDYKMISRKTRIFYKNNFFNYPLTPFNALYNLGIIKSLICLISYIKVFFTKEKKLKSFEDWIVQKFGRKLYEIFFKSYSEKLWGISCKKLSSEFAAQRIKKFNLGEAIKNFFFANKKHKTLVDEFAYPNNGTGKFYNKLAYNLKKKGGKIFFKQKINKINYIGKKIKIEISKKKINYDYLISSMPLTTLANLLNPDRETAKAIKKLNFRNTLLVYVKVNKLNIFDDQWIYINSEEIFCGRITNFNNWGGGENKYTILCFEYWFDDNDVIWKNKRKILDLVKKDILKLNFFPLEKVSNYKIVPINKCYPVYNLNYKKNLNKVKKFLNKFTNIFPIGRYGSFKYNNQDHSILMGILVSEKISESKKINLWDINTDYEFQESAIITSTGLKKI